jgi:rhomboid protease GluP
MPTTTSEANASDGWEPAPPKRHAALFAAWARDCYWEGDEYGPRVVYVVEFPEVRGASDRVQFERTDVKTVADAIRLAQAIGDDVVKQRLPVDGPPKRADMIIEETGDGQRMEALKGARPWWPGRPHWPRQYALLGVPLRSAVWALVAVNVAVFGLELLWGGVGSPITLHRMGAGLGRAGLADEPWRIVSAAFLHFNIVHLALNMWALVVFGRLLERMLGAHRLIVLYALSAAGGGLASSLVHAQILSAGASGAVWGLMTAQIALIVRLKMQQGAEQVPVPMSILVQPLVVNLLISVLPFIDLAAHLGGGFVGAGLIFSGLMWGPRPAAAWRPAAWAVSLAMAGCLVLALAHGRPWELRWPPPLVPRAIPGTPITVPVPRGQQARPGRDKGVTVFGDHATDSLVVYCWVKRNEPAISDQQRPEYLRRVARDWGAQPLDEGESRESPPRVVQLAVRPAVSLAFRYPSGSINRMWVMVEGRWWVQLEVATRPNAPASWAEAASSIADGIAIRAE